MSLSAAYPAATVEPAETRKLLLVIWAATVVASLFAGGNPAHWLSTDDAMRLVEVRDFLAGQSWFDLVQHRLNPPQGVAMHWSRIIDVPIAFLIRTGELVLPAAQAEKVAMLVWPAGLLLVFLAAIVGLARALANDAAARLALIFAALMAAILQHFRPGALDHHNVQLVLLLWTLVLVIRNAQAAGIAAGALCGLSLAVGQETAPLVAAIAALVALRWAVVGESERLRTAGFGLSFAGVTVTLFAATIPSSRYFAPACDSLSIVQVIVAMIGGIGLAVVARMRVLTTLHSRLAGLVALAAALAATVGFGFPACLANPYAHLDPRLTALWLSNVSEARSIVSLAHDLPQEVLPDYGLPAAGLALGFAQCWRTRDAKRWYWIISTGLLAVASVIAVWEMRGCAAANAIALAMVPAALVKLLSRTGSRVVSFGLSRNVLIAAAFLNPLALIGIGKAAAFAAERTSGLRPPTVLTDGPGTCRRPADYAPLARLPRGLVLGFIDAGPFILMETPHTVLAAPYHRNLAGNAAMLDVFLSTPQAAGVRLAGLRVDYIAFCPGAPERHNYAAAAPDGLAAALSRGDVPRFLERTPLAGTDLVVYRRLH